MAHSLGPAAHPVSTSMPTSGPNQPRLDLQVVMQAEQDLAACFRMAARNGLEEGICNHFSALVPGYDDLFIVNPYGYAFRELTASRLLVCDFHGNVVEGEGRPEATAFYIHAAHPQERAEGPRGFPHPHALRDRAGHDGRRPADLRRPDLAQILRSHGGDRDYNGLALDEREGDRIAAAVGEADIVFMKHHGVLGARADDRGGLGRPLLPGAPARCSASRCRPAARSSPSIPPSPRPHIARCAKATRNWPASISRASGACWTRRSPTTATEPADRRRRPGTRERSRGVPAYPEFHDRARDLNATSRSSRRGGARQPSGPAVACLT